MIALISMSISRPLKSLARVADRMARGDLDIAMDVRSSDETGLVASSMEKTAARLRQYIAYIDEISTVLDQIGDSNLVFELTQDYTGDFSRIKISLLKIQKTLANALKQISRTSSEAAALNWEGRRPELKQLCNSSVHSPLHDYPIFVKNPSCNIIHHLLSGHP